MKIMGDHTVLWGRKFELYGGKYWVRDGYETKISWCMLKNMRDSIRSEREGIQPRENAWCQAALYWTQSVRKFWTVTGTWQFWQSGGFTAFSYLTESWYKCIHRMYPSVTSCIEQEKSSCLKLLHSEILCKIHHVIMQSNYSIPFFAV